MIEALHMFIHVYMYTCTRVYMYTSYMYTSYMYTCIHHTCVHHTCIHVYIIHVYIYYHYYGTSSPAGLSYALLLGYHSFSIVGSLPPPACAWLGGGAQMLSSGVKRSLDPHIIRSIPYHYKLNMTEFTDVLRPMCDISYILQRYINDM